MIIMLMVHQMFSLPHDWLKHVMLLNIPQLKLRNMRVIFPNFEEHIKQKICEGIIQDSSVHLARKYAWMFLLGHHLLLKADSFPCTMLSEGCSLLGTDNVCGQISKHISVPNGGYCIL